MSIKGVHCGLRLPERTLATSVASRPTVCPAASTTYHLRFSASPVPLGKCVDIDNSLWFKRLERERLEYRNGLKNVKLRATKTAAAGSCLAMPVIMIVNMELMPSFETRPAILKDTGYLLT